MLNERQFSFVYDQPEMGGSTPLHRVTAWHDGAVYQPAGNLIWQRGGTIRNVEVKPEFQRRGVATGMWNEAHRLAEENPKIPRPQHSAERTNSGDAWARSVGGRLPRRSR